jgi:preprotein translocase subunit SecE
VKRKIEELKSFLQDVNQEVRRVTWPTPKEIAGATLVVVVTTAFLSALLFVLDFVIARLLDVVLR